MADKIEVSIDKAGVVTQLNAIFGNLNKQLSSALNDAAFGLRKIWLDLIRTEIDKPTSFTQRVFVKKAGEDNLESTTFLPPVQSEYLGHLIFGGTRRPGEIGTLNRDVLLPVSARLNTYGNLPSGPRRWIGSLEEKIPRAVVTATHNSGGRKAVYQRMSNNRLKLLAVFKQFVPYQPTLHIEKATESYASVAENLIQKVLREV